MSSEAIRFYAATDVGQVRDHNEDNFLVDKKLGLFIVADGMGGHAAGEVASAVAVRTVHEELRREQSLLTDYISGARGASRVTTNEVLTLLEHAVQRACAKVHEESEADPAKRGMGTTLSALLVLGQKGFIAHVGDSRIYLMRGARVQQLTEDHTVQNELIKRGKLTQEQIEKIGNKRNAITRAIGVYERVDVDTLMLELLPSDQFLLSTDGLWQYLADESELRPALASEGDVATKELIALANTRGGSDNITVVLVKIYGDSPEAEERARMLALKRDVLAKVPIFSRLSERELLRVMQIADTRKVALGQTIIREGDRGDELFVMLSGHVGVSRGGSILTHLGAGQNFGEMALIRSVPRSATVVAESNCEVLAIRRSDFFEMLRSDHEVGLKMLWQFLGVLAERLDQTSGELRSAREELAAEELDIAPDGGDDEPSPFSMR